MAQRNVHLMVTLALGTVVMMVGLTAIALLTSRFGWKIYLELLSHFQLQYFVLSTLGLIVLAVLRYKSALLVGLLCWVVLALQILPWYWPPRFLQPREPGNLRVLIANVNTQNQQYDEAIALVRQENPDLALFMEVDEGWRDRLHPLRSDLPYSSGEANPSNLGILLYSRYPLENVRVVAFGSDSTPSLVGTVALNHQSICLVGIHPLPPVRPTFFHSRNEQLNRMGQHINQLNCPTLVMGDMNITMWSPYYQRLIRQTGLKNARDGFGILPSWPTHNTYNQVPSWASLLLSIPIDHFLLSPKLEVANIRVGTDIGSDHRPVILDLRL